MRAPTRSLSRMSAILEMIVDEDAGIIERLREVHPDAGEPDFFHFEARASNTSAFAPQKNFRAAGGASVNRELAMAKAVGEAVERYSTALFRTDELPLTTAAKAPFECVAPDHFALYAAEQHADPSFPWAPFGKNTPVRWTPTQDILTGETIHVPAAFVWMPYAYVRGSYDTPIGQPISTGLASHCSFEEAALGGLCEVIERDAVMIMWLARMSMPHIDLTTLDDANYEITKRLRRAGDEVFLLDVTNDTGVPTILCVLRGSRGNGAPLVFAGSAAPTREDAARKAMEEAAHTRRYCHGVMRAGFPTVHESDFLEVDGQADHLAFYCDPANTHYANFVLASETTKDFQDVVSPGVHSPWRDLRIVAERIAATGHRPLVADLTSPDIAGIGFNVTRAVVPGFHPLFLGHQLRALGGRRLWEVPQRVGYRGIDCVADANTAPHPYP